MRSVTATFLFLAAVLFITPAAYACGCPTFGFDTLEQETASRLRRAKAVFSGEVVKVEGEERPFTTTIRVALWWKGPLTEEVVLVGDRSSCDYQFTLGEKYLVFAYEWEGKLTTGSCWRNSKLDNAAFQLKVLGKGKRPKRKE